MSTRYRKDLPIVLNNISFKIMENERVAIVGKSGAGKSTIIASIFRLIEP
jgi:ATP-binding cassette, subfamily C (CFTR/MRP), member 1